MRRKASPASASNSSHPPTSRNQPRKRRSYKADTGSPKRKHFITQDNRQLEEAVEHTRGVRQPPTPPRDTSDDTLQSANASRSGSGGSGVEDVPKGWKKVRHNLLKKPGSPGTSNAPLKYDPDEYLHAKKRLKKAVMECYRYAGGCFYGS